MPAWSPKMPETRNCSGTTSASRLGRTGKLIWPAPNPHVTGTPESSPTGWTKPALSRASTMVGSRSARSDVNAGCKSPTGCRACAQTLGLIAFSLSVYIRRNKAGLSLNSLLPGRCQTVRIRGTRVAFLLAAFPQSIPFPGCSCSKEVEPCQS
jgi:hypothetical protein